MRMVFVGAAVAEVLDIARVVFFLGWCVFRGPGGFDLCCTNFFGLILQLSIKFRKILFNIDDILVFHAFHVKTHDYLTDFSLRILYVNV